MLSPRSQQLLTKLEKSINDIIITKDKGDDASMELGKLRIEFIPNSGHNITWNSQQIGYPRKSLLGSHTRHEGDELYDKLREILTKVKSNAYAEHTKFIND